MSWRLQSEAAMRTYVYVPVYFGAMRYLGYSKKVGDIKPRIRSGLKL